MDNDFITLQEAARIMEKSVQTLRRLIKKGVVKSQRVKTPQGFHYIVSRDDLAAMGYIEQKEMFSNSPIQTPIQQAVEVHKDADIGVSPIQKEIPTSQPPIQGQEDADYYVLDRRVENNVVKCDDELKALHAIIDAHHQEKIMLFRILEKLQDELQNERSKTACD